MGKKKERILIIYLAFKTQDLHMIDKSREINK